MATPEKDNKTVTEFATLSNDTTAAPVAVLVGTGSPALARMVENVVMAAWAGTMVAREITAAETSDAKTDWCTGTPEGFALEPTPASLPPV